MSRLPEQARAGHALATVHALEGRDAKLRSDFCSYAKSLPATIRISGLGTATAMLLARSRGGEGNQEAYRELLRGLEDWLCGSWPDTPYRAQGVEQGPDGERVGLALIRRITERDQDQYALAEAEALLWLEWLKKLANGLLTDEPPASDRGS